jgi:hypothetical protein
MDACPHVAQPGFWERLAFFLERFVRLQQIGAGATYGMENGAPLVGRPLTEAEQAEGEYIRLLSAVRHLSWGVSTSRWTQDSYLERLQRATPELRARALAECHFAEADYERWLMHFGDTVPPATR